MNRLLTALLALLVLAPACGQAVGNPGVAAAVNGEEIGIDVITERLREVANSPAYADLLTQQEPADAEQLVVGTILGQFIAGRLYEQSLAEQGLAGPSDEEVADELQVIIDEQFGSQEAFEEQVVIGQGASEASVREQVRLGMVVQRAQDAVVADVDVSDADIEAIYEQQFATTSVAHILVATEEEAQAVLERLEAGEDFAAVATEVSLDQGSAAQGGQLGPLQPGQFVPEFEAAALALGNGEISAPVETQFGWHIITAQEPPPLDDELRAAIRPTALQQAQQLAVQDFTEELLTNGDVVVNPRFGEWDALQRAVVFSDPLGALEPVAGTADGDQPLGDVQAVPPADG